MRQYNNVIFHHQLDNVDASLFCQYGLNEDEATDHAYFLIKRYELTTDFLTEIRRLIIRNI